MDRPFRLRALVIATAALLPLTACSLTGGEDSSSDASGDAAAPQEVVLVTHDSFFLPKKLIKAFERDSRLRPRRPRVRRRRHAHQQARAQPGQPAG